jgi:hypothetical protein
MTFNNIFNFGFSPSIKETYFEQFLALIFSFASSFTRTSQSLFPSLYGTDNFLALVSFPLSSVLCVVFVAAAAAAAAAEEEEEEEEVVVVKSLAPVQPPIAPPYKRALEIIKHKTKQQKA